VKSSNAIGGKPVCQRDPFFHNTLRRFGVAQDLDTVSAYNGEVAVAIGWGIPVYMRFSRVEVDIWTPIFIERGHGAKGLFIIKTLDSSRQERWQILDQRLFLKVVQVDPFWCSFVGTVDLRSFDYTNKDV